MALLGFKSIFADAVERGEKRQTIRAERKRPIKVREKLYLYTGLGTKKCRKLWKGDPPPCNYEFGIVTIQ